MSFSKLKESENNYRINSNSIYKSLYKGACVKIKNSQKIFQIVGINPKSEVCWIREWPFSLEVNKTFSLKINQITIQTFCSESFTE
tara:strand:+ start:113 stop:370 length:258 start_codon:yes stop_codon:yes gene_type:complete